MLEGNGRLSKLQVSRPGGSLELKGMSKMGRSLQPGKGAPDGAGPLGAEEGREAAGVGVGGGEVSSKLHAGKSGGSLRLSGMSKTGSMGSLEDGDDAQPL